MTSGRIAVRPEEVMTLDGFLAYWDDFLARVRADYPQFRFVRGRKFTFRPPRTIIFEELKTDLIGVVADQCSVEQNNYDAKNAQNDEHERDDDGRRAQNNYCLQVLHELGHALLGHRDFATDPDRLKMERAAWEEARRLAEGYRREGFEVEYDDEFVEGQLDTYRDWLHQKSRCPQCGLTRYQTPNGQYHCPLCDC